ncbi:MAG: hypothetical protein H7Z14_14560 [Anaerolineae bacterium]|nr:hypothetical protein [Phycisphaerae bacterium]
MTRGLSRQRRTRAPAQYLKALRKCSRGAQRKSAKRLPRTNFAGEKLYFRVLVVARGAKFWRSARKGMEYKLALRARYGIFAYRRSAASKPAFSALVIVIRNVPMPKPIAKQTLEITRFRNCMIPPETNATRQQPDNVGLLVRSESQ